MARQAEKAKKAEKWLETDLYPPVRDFLIEAGYVVRSEVNRCDVVGVRGAEVVVVELKRHLSLALLAQAVDRQQVADAVYVAVPRPKRGGRRQWVETYRVLRKLELGLMFVRVKPATVEVVFHPTPYVRRTSNLARQTLLKEFVARTDDYNRGGSTRRPLMTAYRENAIHIACCLQRFGPMSPRDLRKLGTSPKTLSILYDNYYRWFERVSRGVYTLTAKGQTEMGNYPALTEHYQQVVRSTGQPEAPTASSTEPANG